MKNSAPNAEDPEDEDPEDEDPRDEDPKDSSDEPLPPVNQEAADTAPEALSTSNVQPDDTFVLEVEQALQNLLGSPPKHSAADQRESEPGPPKQLDDFRIIREIARGGMGIVYEAIQESLGRLVALKLLPAHSAADSITVKRFELEAQSAASLHHTNIVPVFSVGCSDNTHYYAMQYIAGCSLSSIISELRRSRAGNLESQKNLRHEDEIEPLERNESQTQEAKRLLNSVIGRVFEQPGAESPENVVTERFTASPHSPLPTNIADQTPATDVPYAKLLESGNKTKWHAIARIGLQASNALAYSAKQGILHRDVKPSNLLLDESGTIWLTDFGLAKAEGDLDLTRPGDFIGTIRYVPPERFNGIADEQGDLYGLGMTLYELIVLRPAFTARDRRKLLKEIQLSNPPSPRSIDRTVPLDLETIVLKLVAKNPSDRYANGELAAADFLAFLENRPISARRLGYVERAWRWCRMNPGLAAATTAALLLTIGLITTLWVSNAAIKNESIQKGLALAEKELALQAKEDALGDSRAANELADRRYYAAQMSLAGHAFQDGDMVRVRESLQQFTPIPSKADLREFAWYYLDRMARAKIEFEFKAPGGRVRGLEFASDGSRLLVTTASPDDGKIIEYGFADLESPVTYGDGREFIGATYFGDHQIIGVSGNTVLVWNRHQLQPIRQIQIERNTQCFLVTNDQRWLLIGGELGTLLPISTSDWNVHPPLKLHSTQLTSLSQPLNSTLVYTCNRWHAEPEICTLETSAPKIIKLNSSPSKYIAAVGGQPPMFAGLRWGDIELIDPETRSSKSIATISHGQIFQLKYSPSGDFLLATGSMERKGFVLSASDLSVVATCAHSAAASYVAVDPQNRRWASGDVTGQVVVSRDPRYVPPKSTLSTPENSSLFLHHDRLLVSAEQHTLVLDPQAIHQSFDQLDLKNCREFSADGRYALVSETPRYGKSDTDTISVWDTKEQRFQARIQKEPRQKYTSMAMSPDAKYVAIYLENEPVELWQVDDSEPKLVHQFRDQKALDMEFSPDGKWLAGVGSSSSVTVWEVKTGRSLGKVLQFPNVYGHAEKVCFSSDSRYVAAGSSAGEIYVYDMQQRKRVGKLLGHLGEVAALEFFPDGRHLVAGGVGDTRVYDFLLNQEVLSLPNEDHKVGDIVVSPNGSWLATLTREGTLRVFNGARRNGD